MKVGDSFVVYREIGSAIRRLRHLQQMTQDDLASHVNLSRASIVNIERGRHRTQIHVLYDIANALSCDIHDLLPSGNSFGTKISPNLEKKLSLGEHESVAKLINIAKTKKEA